MSKQPANAGRQWTPTQEQKLVELAKGNTPTRVIALKMERTEGSVRSKASELDISLMPPNQSPYGTKEKK